MVNPDLILQQFDSVDTNLTSTNTASIKYPFIFIEDVSEVELNYLKAQLNDGEIPLMIKLDEGYIYVKDIDITLNSIKHLSRFKHNRPIFFKESKNSVISIDSFISLLLLEESV